MDFDIGDHFTDGDGQDLAPDHAGHHIGFPFHQEFDRFDAKTGGKKAVKGGGFAAALDMPQDGDTGGKADIHGRRSCD